MQTLDPPCVACQQKENSLVESRGCDEIFVRETLSLARILNASKFMRHRSKSQAQVNDLKVKVKVY